MMNLEKILWKFERFRSMRERERERMGEEEGVDRIWEREEKNITRVSNNNNIFILSRLSVDRSIDRHQPESTEKCSLGCRSTT